MIRVHVLIVVKLELTNTIAWLWRSIGVDAGVALYVTKCIDFNRAL
jgi:hypothetical protein